jgi:hypothetical protein
MAGWLFFRVALSARINSDMLVVRALKNRREPSLPILCEHSG